MLQNGSKNYKNVDLKDNATRYCNGHLQMATASAPKKESKRRNGKMVPSKEDIPLPGSLLSVDNKLKFSDRLNVLLKTKSSATDNGMEVDDPYAFSEPEPQVFRLYQNNSSPNNTYVRKCLPKVQTTLKNSDQMPTDHAVISNGQVNDHVGSVTRLYPALSASLGHSLPAANSISAETRTADDDSSKTMNRLQAKIAQNKVIGKHKRVRPSSRNLNPSAGAPAGKHNGPKKERSLLEEQLLGIKTEFCVKKEPEETKPKSYKAQQHGSSHQPLTSIPAKRRRSTMTSRQNETPWHEALQRIQESRELVRDYHEDLYPLGVEVSDSESSDSEEAAAVFQKHWFSSGGHESNDGNRVGRLALARAEMRRRLAQVRSGVGRRRRRDRTRDDLTLAMVDTAMAHPSQVARFVRAAQPRRFPHATPAVRKNRSKMAMLVRRVCTYRKGEEDACAGVALPCTHHCLRHVMYNVDQLLFEYCTAKFSDNTQCCEPVFDICHELPLCVEHARKRDNYDKMCAEVKPKKIRKKAKPSAMTRPNKRGKKKRRAQKTADSALPLQPARSFKQTYETELPEIDMGNLCSDNNFDMYIKEEIVESFTHPDSFRDPDNFTDPEIPVMMKDDHPVVEGVEEVLAMAGLPLDPAELASQASRLLEEHDDLTNVLNHIPADAFNDLFTEDKNGAYEPTREETEELERALEAVDNDVKSLQKLSQTQGLLETLMDDHALVTSLSQLPEVQGIAPPPVYTSYHHNGSPQWPDHGLGGAFPAHGVGRPLRTRTHGSELGTFGTHGRRD